MSARHIDWQAVRAKMQANAQALEESLNPSSARRDEIYRQRAILLAKTADDGHNLTPGVAVLVFGLGMERYAIELKYLGEVLPLGYCASIPHAPSQFLGVINVRGELRTVVDLRATLGLQPAGTGTSSYVLMLRPSHGDPPFGLQIDAIQELREVRLEELKRMHAGPLALGVVEGHLTVLDAEALLAAIHSTHPIGRESST